VRTLRWWRQSTTFQQALRASARQAASEASSRLIGAQGEAVVAMLQALHSPSESVRLRAATTIIELAQKAACDDTDQRLTDLERRPANGSRPAGTTAGKTF
jgi:HEAT repeat protein